MPNPRLLTTRQRLSCWVASMLCWGAILTTGCPTYAQEDQVEARTAVSVTPTGLQRFSSGRWSSVSVVAANPTDQDSEETIAVYFKEAPGQQFSTTLWVPAGATRQSWIPVRVPDLPMQTGRVNLSSIRIKQTDSGESFTNNLLGMSVGERSLMLSNNEINTALTTNSTLLGSDANNSLVIEGLLQLINTGRDTTIQSQLELPTSKLAASFLPPTNNALDELDQLVIAGDHLLGDTSGLAAVRRWIRRGGRVWIMLDRTSERLVRELLGDAARYSVIDRVELNELQFVMGKGVIGAPSMDGDSWESESPVEMLRILTESQDIDAWVDGWPVSFWQPYGDGEVVFSTLGYPAWFKSGGSVSEGKVEKEKTGNTTLYRVSRRFFEPRVAQPDPLVEMRPLLADAIGYQIPSRSVAASILGANVLVILCAGIWWARRRSLEKMAILIPVCALVTTAAMLWVGARNAVAVPSTVATGQLVTVSREFPEADASVLRGVYLQNAGDPGVQSPNGLLTMPDSQEGTSATRRVSLNDSGDSRLVGPEQPPGVIRHLSSESMLSFDQPVGLVGTFDKNGFVGQVTGLDSKAVQDGVIVALPLPATALRPDESSGAENAFRADVDGRLSPGQFIPGSLLSDQQRIRQDFLRRVCLRTEEGAGVGARLSCLLWTDALDLGVEFASDMSRSGVSLMSVPITVNAPEPDVEFRIPATFTRTEGFAGARGISSMFNPRTGEWLQALTTPAETELILKFPESVAGMTIQKVDVEMKAFAPSRTLYVKTMRDGNVSVAYQTQDPTGLIRFSIGGEGQDELQMHPDGGLWLAIGVTESANATEIEAFKDPRRQEGMPEPIAAGRSGEKRVVDNTTWQIEHAYFDVVARIKSDADEIEFELPKAGSQ